ncbi:hypothetical protein [Roseivivax sp. THAF30]|uniref:hypothetical protein n=1 Tax=Roseivivax sp. THAF30 TaxID=2587852 RepID=UPI001268DFA8|nr:hypothetical protein [Roseivivax sp. THAF30]QFT62281.1 hypothetical protein FIU91_05015 [Roseivivax sp. THAF30]
MSAQTTKAVLSGDLIGSRESPAEVAPAFAALERGAARFGAAWDIDLRFTRFRGDGWQILLTNPRLVLDATIFLTASLTAAVPKLSTRISAGIGTVDSEGSADLSDASGPAFFISGDHLDHIGKRRLAVAASTTPDWLPAIFDLVAELMSGWTQAQAEAVVLALDPDIDTHDDIAKRLKITRQAVQSRLASAGFGSFENALAAVRNADFEAMRR